MFKFCNYYVIMALKLNIVISLGEPRLAEREKIPTLIPELGNSSVGKCVDFYLPITDIQVMGYIFIEEELK